MSPIVCFRRMFPSNGQTTTLTSPDGSTGSGKRTGTEVTGPKTRVVRMGWEKWEYY